MTTITLDPRNTLIDEPVHITVSEVPSRARVMLRLRAVTFGAESSAEFIADADGTVHVTDPMRLFWDATFEPGADVMSMLKTLASLAPLPYELAVDVADYERATLRFERYTQAPGIVRTPVNHARVRGALFAREGAHHAPAVVVLGGSDGGNQFEYVAALLAARGFAALLVPYFAYDDLPADLVEIPLEYFAGAIGWLRARPEVDRRRVAVLGMSYGGQLALLLGAHFPDAVGAVVALVPSGISGGAVTPDPQRMARAAWTLAGQAVPFIPPRYDPVAMKAFSDAMASGKPMAMTPGFRQMLEHTPLDDVVIPVERIAGPVLLMSAGDDQVWPSDVLAEIAVSRLRAHGGADAVQYLSYPHAGHFSCLPPYIPTTMTWSRHPVVPFVLEMGGTPEANAAASADLWPRIIAFLQRSQDGG